MGLLSELQTVGCNINEGKERMMGNEALYEKLLKKFPSSVFNLEVMPFIEKDDIQTAISNAHTIKGVTGNLSLTPLFTNYTQIVDLLRANKVEEAKELYIATIPIQQNIVEIIQNYS